MAPAPAPIARWIPLLGGLAGLLGSNAAHAGGLVGDGASRRVEQETMLVVWDHEKQEQHLVLGARASGLSAAGGYLTSVPREAQLAEPLDGVAAAITALVPGARPLATTAGEDALLLSDGLVGVCKRRRLSCDADALTWASERSVGHGLVLLPLAASTTGATSTAYAHLRFAAERPIVPFAEPVDASIDPEPPLPDAEHPARVRLWLELFNETPAGRWERQMDDAAEARAPDLAACYAPALERRRRLAGSVQVQLRIGPDQLVTVEEESAEPASLDPVARCLATALTRPGWPKQGFGKAIRVTVHASLRPPAATPRRLLAVVLSTRDVEPKLGHADDPRVVPDLQPLVSLEPSPSALAAAVPEPLRQALGLDLRRRWRLVAFETGADPHSQRDDIEMRPLRLPEPRPGDAPVPIVARGDRPEGYRAAMEPAPWWRRRRVRRGASGLLALALVGVVLWRERRR